VGNLVLRHSTFVLRHFLNIRSIGGIGGCLLPYELVSWPQLRHGSSVGGLSIVFENFAPPFPEKELRDGTPKKAKK
jgi:hypothetical protein